MRLQGWSSILCTPLFVWIAWAAVSMWWMPAEGAIVQASEPAPPEGDVVFAAGDPEGDDHGPGHYTYPTHASFAPGQGLFDLLFFRVSRTATAVHFDVRFAAVTNPWGAPEGFFHQRVDIYIDAVPFRGSIEPWKKGPQVRFAPESGWEYLVRIAPFGGSRFVVGAGVSGTGEQVVLPVTASLLADGHTIRVTVPGDRIAPPAASWKYHVLVGGYDVFGPDEYRAVTAEAGEWTFGGARGEGAPWVIDILAPGWGRHTQESQLDPGGAAAGQPVVLYPLDSGWTRQVPLWMAAGLAGLAVVALGALLWRWRAARNRTR